MDTPHDLRRLPACLAWCPEGCERCPVVAGGSQGGSRTVGPNIVQIKTAISQPCGRVLLPVEVGPGFPWVPSCSLFVPSRPLSRLLGGGTPRGSHSRRSSLCGPSDRVEDWRVHACAFHRAKSSKVIGGLPVTFSMSSFGREPLPEMMVPASQRRATAAMSAASTKPSAPPRVGTVMAPSMTGRCSSLKFCITHAGRRMECVKAPRHARSSSSAPGLLLVVWQSQRVPVAGGVAVDAPSRNPVVPDGRGP